MKLEVFCVPNLVPRAIMSFSCRTQLPGMAVESLDEKGIMALGSRLLRTQYFGDRLSKNVRPSKTANKYHKKHQEICQSFLTIE